MPQTRIVKLERLEIPDGKGGVRTGRYFVRPGSRSRPWIWFDVDEVPPFDGEVGWFELQRVRGGWKVVGAAPKPARER